MREACLSACMTFLRPEEGEPWGKTTGTAKPGRNEKEYSCESCLERER